MTQQSNQQTSCQKLGGINVLDLHEKLHHVNSIVRALDVLGSDNMNSSLTGTEVSILMDLIAEKLEPVIATLSDHIDNERKKRIAKEREALGNVEQSA